MNQMLTLIWIAAFLKVHPNTIARIASPSKKSTKGNSPTYDPAFPEYKKIGRSVYVDSDKFFSWLSKKAGKKITAEDALLTGGDMQDYYSRSSTWLWQQVRDKEIEKPFKINRNNYWLKRSIYGEVEA